MHWDYLLSVDGHLAGGSYNKIKYSGNYLQTDQSSRHSYANSILITNNTFSSVSVEPILEEVRLYNVNTEKFNLLENVIILCKMWHTKVYSKSP